MSTFLAIQVPPDAIRRARAGDREAQRRLYEALARPVYTLLRRIVVRPAIAEELMQETFLEVLVHLEAFTATGSFAGWVRTIAVRKALAHLRSPWHGRLGCEPLEALAAAPGDAGAHSEWQDQLECALNALPALGRSIVWLHDVEGYTHTEIAQLYGQTTSFSKSQLMRAHAALRELLEPDTGAQPCTLASTT